MKKVIIALLLALTALTVFVSCEYEEPAVTSISVKTLPANPQYLNCKLDTTGMVVVGKLSNGNEIELTNYTVSPSVLNTLGTTKITVSYEKKNYSTKRVSFFVNVVDKSSTTKTDNAETTTKKLTSLSVVTSPTTTTFYYDSKDIHKEQLDLSGMVVVAKYSDNSTKTVTNYSVYHPLCSTTDFDESMSGNQDLLVVYTEDGNAVCTTVTITVADYDDLFVLHEPYEYGECGIFDYQLSCGCYSGLVSEIKKIVFTTDTNLFPSTSCTDITASQSGKVTTYLDVANKVIYVIGERFVANENSAKLFCGGSFSESLSSVDGLEFLDTSRVTYMFQMFCQLKSLQSLDLSSFDTSNVTSMECMFAQCTSLTDLNLSSFDLSSLTEKMNMFELCDLLSKIYCNTTTGNLLLTSASDFGLAGNWTYDAADKCLKKN